jgi:hypothetical protein
MRRGLFPCAGLLVLALPAQAEQSPLADPSFAGTLVGQVCVTQSLDFPAIFTQAKAVANAAALAQVMADDKIAMFGDPAGLHLVFSKRIDGLACALTVPDQTGTPAYFETLRASIGQRVSAVYPDALSVDSDPASPHEEKHEWMFRVPAERHFAVTLEWQTEDGVSLAIGYSQIYE